MHNRVVLLPAQPLVHQLNSSTDSRTGTGHPGAPCHAPPSPTCVGVRVMTKLREMERQSPLPYLAKPMRNRLQGRKVAGARQTGEPVSQTSG